MDYYRQVNGMKMDGRLLSLAEEAVKGAGDGRISKQDAEKLLSAVLDGNIYTDIEKGTVEYIHRNFRWTEPAWDWFSHQLKSWEEEFQKPVRMTPEEVSKQHFPKEDVLDSEGARISRENDLRAATSETYQDHDEIGIIVRLVNGQRVEVLSNFIEFVGNLVELRGGFTIPVRAIEKVEI